jgi:exodeoxyribonuclease V gamma subunit
VPGVYGDLLRTVTYSKVNARHRLVAWVRFLALTAADPDRPYEAATVGRPPFGAGAGATATVVRLPRLEPEQAVAHLATLLDLYDRGMREPLPLACKTSAAYADALRRGDDAAKAATAEWQTGYRFANEDQEPEHELVFGGVLTFDELCARPGFEDCARELWDPLLAWEEVEHR